MAEDEVIRIQVFRICDKVTGKVFEQTTSGSRAQRRREELYGLDGTELRGVTMEFNLSEGRVVHDE